MRSLSVMTGLSVLISMSAAEARPSLEAAAVDAWNARPCQRPGSLQPNVLKPKPRPQLMTQATPRARLSSARAQGWNDLVVARPGAQLRSQTEGHRKTTRAQAASNATDAWNARALGHPYKPRASTWKRLDKALKEPPTGFRDAPYPFGERLRRQIPEAREGGGGA